MEESFMENSVSNNSETDTMVSDTMVSDTPQWACYDIIPDICIIINREGIVQYCNSKINSIGYDISDLIGNNITMLIPSEIAKNHDNYIKAFIETGKSNIIGSPGRHVNVITKNNCKMSMYLNINNFKYNDEYFFLGILSDTTKYIEQINNQIELNTAKREFIQYIFHESRGWLNSVYIGINLISNIIEHNDFINKQTVSIEQLEKIKAFDVKLDIKDIISDMALSLDSVTKLYNDTINIQQIEGGKFVYEYNDIYILKILYDTFKGIRSNIKSKNAKITFDIDKIYMRNLVIGDELRLKQCLYNFISNSIKFIEFSGNIHIEVKHIINNDNDMDNIIYTKIKIKDDGCGVKDEDVQKLFKPFSQIKAKIGTSGLGLSIIKSFIEDGHQGSVGVTSKTILQQKNDKYNSEFYMNIPFKKSTNTDIDINLYIMFKKDIDTYNKTRVTNTIETNTIIKNDDKKDNFQHFDILVVDDDLFSGKLYCRLFDMNNVTYKIALNGVEAIKFITEKKYNFDVIFMDKEMPEMDGFECIKQLRKLGIKTPIFGLTGHAFSHQIDEFKRIGATDVLIKPINVDYFKKIIKTYITNNSDSK